MITVVLGVFAAVGPAEAAFPGRDGLLAVAPTAGNTGIVLIQANGKGERRVCAGMGECAGPALNDLRGDRLAWSANGRVLAITTASDLPVSALVYTDGSCLNCGTQGGDIQGGDVTFTTNPTLVTAVTAVPYGRFAGQGELVEYGVDGLLKRVVVSAPVSDGVWSFTGELAIVRAGAIWVGTPGKLRKLTSGHAPSWSPDGKRIVFVRNGWLMLGQVHGHSFCRLVRGSASAWSADGRSIAFIGSYQRLSIIRLSNRRVRRIGTVTGTTVDWQSLPVRPRAACQTPPGSTVIASSPTATVSKDSAQGNPELDVFAASAYTSAYMGCLRADHRERLLIADEDSDGPVTASKAAVAGNYAALGFHEDDVHYNDVADTVDVFDLRTGTALLGGERAGCSLFSSPVCQSSIDQLVLGKDAVSAVHTTVQGQQTNGTTCSCTVEQIQASDSTGVRTLDSVTEPEGSPPALTDLTLTGDTLTWEHNGLPESVELTP